MAGQKSKRRARKRRNPNTAPTAVRSQRREDQAAAERRAIRERQAGRRDTRRQGGVGDRPPSPFDPIPVAEIAIFVGIIGVIVGLVTTNNIALVVGGIVTALGVAEFTAREHFTGFRSHTTLLAAIPAVAVEAIVAAVFGVPKAKILVFLPPAPVFLVCFWLLRKRFQAARQRRVARSRR